MLIWTTEWTGNATLRLSTRRDRVVEYTKLYCALYITNCSDQTALCVCSVRGCFSFAAKSMYKCRKPSLATTVAFHNSHQQLLFGFFCFFCITIFSFFSFGQFSSIYMGLNHNKCHLKALQIYSLFEANYNPDHCNTIIIQSIQNNELNSNSSKSFKVLIFHRRL